MANLDKYTLSQIEKMTAHYARENENYSNKNIDKSKSESNDNLAPSRNQMEYIRDMLEQIPHAKRKDLKVACTWVVTAPSELPKHLTRRFFELSYDFLIKRYGNKSGLGEGVCVSSYIHMDETTPHMHFCMLPVVKDKEGQQRFCCKEVINRHELKTFHTDFSRHLEQHGLSAANVTNGNTLYRKVIDKNGNEKYFAVSVSSLKARSRNHGFERSF